MTDDHVPPDGPVLTLATDGLAVAVWLIGWEPDSRVFHARIGSGRWRYGYRVTMADDAEPITGDDLRSGTRDLESAPEPLPKMLATVLAFLGSGAEYGRPDRPEHYGWDDAPFPAETCRNLYTVAEDVDLLTMSIGDDL